MQDNERELMTHDTSGHILPKLLATLDPESWSWKMSEGISVSDFRKFSKTLPKSGMLQDGQLFELPMLEPHTTERDCSLLPTPTQRHTSNHDEPIEQFLARQARSSTGQIGMSTGVALRLLPTPTTQEGSGICRDHRGDLTHGVKISVLATPSTNSSHTTGKCRDWGADLLHDVKCQCKPRRIHWSMES
jgi:hypothetical protein